MSVISKRRPSLGSCLSHARMLRAEPGILSFSFEPNSFFADQVKSDLNFKELVRLTSDFFGRSNQIQVEALSEEKAPELAPSLADSRENAEREALEEAQRKAREHPMVQEAIRVFGAEVVDVRTGQKQD